MVGAPPGEAGTMTIAIVAGFCVLLLILALLFPPPLTGPRARWRESRRSPYDGDVPGASGGLGFSRLVSRRNVPESPAIARDPRAMQQRHGET
jgi:hypothetical protein